MLSNGLYVEGKDNVTVASGYDICDVCEWEESHKKENQDKSPTEIRRAVSQKTNGRLIKIIPALKNRDGQPARICHECLKKFAAETESID